MDLIRASGNGRKRIRDSQAAVAMAVPIHANSLARGLDDLLEGKFHEVVSALRSSVPNRVA